MTQPTDPVSNEPVGPAGIGRFVVVPAAYVYLVRGTGTDREVLLQLRANTGYMDDHWAAGAAGHVERGETAVDAARRETLEELGVFDPDLDFESTVHRTQRNLPIDERVDFFFTAQRWQGKPRIMESSKCADLRWWPLADLPEHTVPHERMVLERLFAQDLPPYVAWGF